MHREQGQEQSEDDEEAEDGEHCRYKTMLVIHDSELEQDGDEYHE